MRQHITIKESRLRQIIREAINDNQNHLTYAEASELANKADRMLRSGKMTTHEYLTTVWPKILRFLDDLDIKIDKAQERLWRQEDDRQTANESKLRGYIKNMVKEALNEIGDTPKGQWMIGRVAGRAAYNDDNTKWGNVLDRYLNRDDRTQASKGVRYQMGKNEADNFVKQASKLVRQLSYVIYDAFGNGDINKDPSFLNIKTAVETIYQNLDNFERNFNFHNEHNNGKESFL